MLQMSSFHQLILEIQSILESYDQAGHTHPLTVPTPTFFDQLLTYVNLCQHVKNQAISLISSGDMVD